ncbi:MAG: hypothetical protein FK734_18660 [Asgard group archaeon]|nr:hypothetical protein [Asgard group archaeon]
MSKKRDFKPSVKDVALDILEIAHCNLTFALTGLKPNDIHKQILPEINHITWIVGHLAVQMDFILGELCQGKSKMLKEYQDYFAYGVSKEIVKKLPSISFKELVDLYLEIFEDGMNYLNNLPIEKYYNFPEVDGGNKIQESLIIAIERISLHFMGHVGQIYVIRRALENPGGGFVAGMSTENRNIRMQNWVKWWEHNKATFE